MSDLLPGRLKAMSAICREFVPVAWLILAEHEGQLSRQHVAAIRKAVTLLRWIDEDCSTQFSNAKENL